MISYLKIQRLISYLKIERNNKHRDTEAQRIIISYLKIQRLISYLKIERNKTLLLRASVFYNNYTRIVNP